MMSRSNIQLTAAAALLAACTSITPAQSALRSTASRPGPEIRAVVETGWTHAARSPARVSSINLRGELAPPPLGRPATIVNQLADGTPIEFMYQTSPVMLGKIAFAQAIVNGLESLVCVDLESANVLWVRPLPEQVAESWSSPAIDAEHRTVIVAMGDELVARSTAHGAIRWRTPLVAPVVNASPVVTDDLGPRDRVFITDYGFYSDVGRLYCINTDPYDPVLNPYSPGELVWAAPLDANTSGNSSAYENGTVYVATAGDGFGGGGRVLAFDATTDSAPAPRWSFDNVNTTGFFGGVCVRDGSVYAASYGFGGGQLNSNLVKLDANTGSLIWSAASNRTSSTPVPLADGRVVLAGGIMPDPVFGDFGSRPSIAVYSGSGQLQLETALDTWTDTNQDGDIDPNEAMLVGGWTHQPIVLEPRPPAGLTQIVCRVIDETAPGGEGITRLNLDWQFGQSPDELVLQTSPIGSGSPAAGDGWLLSIDDGSLTIRRSRHWKTSP